MESPLAPHNLRVERLVNPMAVNAHCPEFSWQLPWPERGARQTGFELRMACQPEALRARATSRWHTGIETTEAAGLVAAVRYAGPAIAAGEQLFWTVRARNTQGQWSDWAEPGCFGMGLLEPRDWCGAWIGAVESEPWPAKTHVRNHDAALGPETPEEAPAVYLRHRFRCAGPVRRALWYVCGLGYVDLSINGKRVGDAVLDPAFTPYDNYAYYTVHDVTALLAGGEHTLGACLGNGFYNLVTPDLFWYHEAAWRQSPRLLAELRIEYADGSVACIATGPDWEVGEGEVRFNCVRGGETIDHRRTQADWDRGAAAPGAWSAAALLRPPAGRLLAQELPPIRIREVLEPLSVHELRPGLCLVDFGRNLAGWVELEVQGQAGDTIELWHNQRLLPDGTLDSAHSATHTHGRYQRQRCILAGGGVETFAPRFTYHAFRYVQVEARPELLANLRLRACRMHTDLRRTGWFECSDSRFNRLHAACVRTLEDCTFGNACSEPIREKIGWNGDTLFQADAYFSLFDATHLYRKHVRDLVAAQAPNGHVPPIFPNAGWGRLDPEGGREYCDDPWWGGSLADSLRLVLNQTGDLEDLRTYYPAALAYLRYLERGATDYILDWNLGDWMDAQWRWPDGPGVTPVAFTATVGFYRQARMVARFAGLLGLREDEVACNALADHIHGALNQRYGATLAQGYVPGSQTAPALAWMTGLCSGVQGADPLACLVEAVHAAGDRLSAGFIGTLPVLYALCEAGEHDLAYSLVLGDAHEHGWLWMMEPSQYPTLAESPHRKHFNPYTSAQHQFCAGVAAYMHRCLLGIRPDSTRPGFSRWNLQPSFPKVLDWVRGAQDIPQGRIEVEWRRDARGIELQVGVPANTEAQLKLPKSSTRLPAGRHVLRVLT